MSSLFPDQLLAKAEEEKAHHDEKCSASTSHKKPAHFHPYTHSGKQAPEVKFTSIEAVETAQGKE